MEDCGQRTENRRGQRKYLGWKEARVGNGVSLHGGYLLMSGPLGWRVCPTPPYRLYGSPCQVGHLPRRTVSGKGSRAGRLRVPLLSNHSQQVRRDFKERGEYFSKGIKNSERDRRGDGALGGR